MGRKKGDQMKPWACEKGHVLGQAMRNGRGITQLLLYRLAVDMTAEEPVEVDIMATLEGLVMDVRCSVCGSIRTWEPDQRALDRMVAALEMQRNRAARRLPIWEGGDGQKNKR